MTTLRDPWISAPSVEDAKRDALQIARCAAREFELQHVSRNAAIRRAHRAGASLREISTATGVSHMTVKRILSRSVAA